MLDKILKNKKIQFITTVSAIILIAALCYFYLPKLWSPAVQPEKSIKQISEFSRTDARPDEIKGKIITLKKLKREYFQDYHKMCTPTVRKPLYFPIYGTYEWTKNFLEKQLKKEATSKLFVYIIFDNKDNKLIGSIEIREKNPKDPGQFGCWLNENYWGGGRMREAIKLVTNAYFKLKNVDSFNAHVEMWNLRSYYALKKAGFKLVDFYHENGKTTRYILEFYNPNKTKK